MDCIAEELVEMGVDPDDIGEVQALVSFSVQIKDVTETFVMADAIENLSEKQTILKIIAKIARGKNLTASEITRALNREDDDEEDYGDYKPYKRPQVIEKSMSELLEETKPKEDEELDLRSQMENFFKNMETKEEPKEEEPPKE